MAVEKLSKEQIEKRIYTELWIICVSPLLEKPVIGTKEVSV